MSSTPFHHARLLRDVHELNSHPYPNIILHSHPTLTTACLILTPPGLPPIHLTCTFPPRYPIHPPRITIQTKFIHPNVFGDYICASILNTNEGYTPAYTLKGIAIQMLSFFNSEKVQQQYDGEVVDIKAYRERKAARAGRNARESFVCAKCDFPALAGTTSEPAVGSLGDNLGRLAVSSPNTDQGNAQVSSIVVQGSLGNTDTVTETEKKKKNGHKATALDNMHSEILIRICDFLESEELIVFMRAWEVVGGAKGVVTEYGLIRKRELLCFVTKEGFGTERLGIGVRVWGGGKIGTIESEFDLLSEKAYKNFKIHTSVQGIEFEHWLPLPLSRRHYQMVKELIGPSLREIAKDARLTSMSTLSSAIPPSFFRALLRFPTYTSSTDWLTDYDAQASVLFAFMNDVVVKLSQHTTEPHPSEGSTSSSFSYGAQSAPTSSIQHASEKAIESYYHLFHLLLCLASSDSTIIPAINRTISRFLAGHTDKTAIPNLGHLLTMLLISDYDLDYTLTMALLKEAVTRNVVWMLDRKGADMPELSYMESDAISQYRLKKTYQSSRTSYRLLMFAELFRGSVDRGSGENRKSVVQLRDELFDKLGAPPRGAVEKMAGEVKRLEKVDDFPNFLVVMGVKGSKMPKASEFTGLLRECCEESVRKGYSVWAIGQADALGLRTMEGKEPGVGVRAIDQQKAEWKGVGRRGTSFFPGKGRRQLNDGNRGFSIPSDWR